MKKFLLAFSVMLGLLLLTPLAANAADDGASGNTAVDPARRSVCEGVGLTGGSCDDAGGTSLSGVMKIVIHVLSAIVGVIAVFMIIIGGLKYITSAGDANSINSAKNTILYAVVGLVIVALAQFLVRFVIEKAGEAPAATPPTSLQPQQPNLLVVTDTFMV